MGPPRRPGQRRGSGGTGRVGRLAVAVAAVAAVVAVVAVVEAMVVVLAGGRARKQRWSGCWAPRWGRVYSYYTLSTL